MKKTLTLLVFFSLEYFLGTLQIHKKYDDFEFVEGEQYYLISGPQHFAA
jgi:hypothetical protein